MKTKLYMRSAEFYWLPAISSYRCFTAREEKGLAKVTRAEVKFFWLKLQLEF